MLLVLGAEWPETGSREHTAAGYESTPAGNSAGGFYHTNMITTGTNHTELKKDYAQIYEQRTLMPDERVKVVRAANGIRQQIVQFFEQFPDARIAPSEFKELMKLPNAIHSIRPRFTDLENEHWLVALDNDRVRTDYNGEERRYMRMADNGQMRLL